MEQLLDLGPFRLVLSGLPLASPRGALGWSSALLIRNNGRTMLFDAGSHADAELLRQSLAHLDCAPEDISGIVLSHLHYDHASGISGFPNAEIYVSKEEIYYAQRVAEDPWLDPSIDIAAFQSMATDRVRAVEDGDVLAGLTVRSLPGHTPGSIGLIDPVSKIICTGDALKNAMEFAFGRTESGADRTSATRTIANLRRLANFRIVPGHDRPFLWAGDRILFLAESEVTISISTLDAQGRVRSEVIRIHLDA